MPPRRPAVAPALATLAGAALGPILSTSILTLMALAGPLAVLALRRHRRVAPPLAVAAFLLGVAGLAGAWAATAHARLGPLRPEVVPCAGPVALEGEVLEAPAGTLPGRARLRLRTAGADVQLEGPRRVLHDDLLPGARVQVVGRFVAARTTARASGAPPPAGEPGGYDPARALRRRGVAWRLEVGELRVLAPGRGPAALLAACVRQARGTIDRAARPRHAAFLRAVLLGERGALDPAAAEAFRRTGTAHLLSISGLHVTALAGLVLLLSRALGLRPGEQALAAGACVLLYVAVAGAAVPTVRAAAAGVVGFALLGRGDAWNRLAVGLIVALAVDPLAVRDAGTVLSFGTVAGLLALEPLLRRALSRRDPLGALRPPSRADWLAGAARRLVPTPLAAFLASAPLLAVTLGTVPLASALLNPPAIALFTVALALGLAGALAGALAPPLGQALVGAADLVTGWLFRLVEAGVGLPEATVAPPAPAAGLVAAGLLAVGALRRERRAPGARPALALGVVLAAGLVLPRPDRSGAPLAPPRRAPADLRVLVGPGALRVTVDREPGLLLGRAARGARGPAASTRARLPGAQVAPLSSDAAWVQAGGVRALLVAGRPTGAAARALLAAAPRADVVVAPSARPALARALVERCGARAALVDDDVALPPGVTRLAAARDGALRLPPRWP